jgi:type II secretory pathway component PulC
MKQNLWIVNTSLLMIFALSLGLYNLLHEDAPPRPPRKIPLDVILEEPQKDGVGQIIAPAWEKIYQDDVFGTYVASKPEPTQKSLIKPMPEPPRPTPIPPPEPKRPDFIPALTVTLRGIIAGSDESQNVAMLADETNKELLYHVGDKVKDAQIIRIASNRVVMLRATGQQETFYLRPPKLSPLGTPDQPDPQDPLSKWKMIVKKVDDKNFEIDPIEFKREVETLGTFLERAAVIGTAFQEGKAVGIRLGTINATDLITALGLKTNDLVTSVNGIFVGTVDDRMKAYEQITKASVDSTISVGLVRDNQDLVISYKLVKLERPSKFVFSGLKPGTPSAPGAAPAGGQGAGQALPKSKLQEWEEKKRDFERRNPSDHDRMMMEIRQRLMQNLQNRSY